MKNSEIFITFRAECYKNALDAIARKIGFPRGCFQRGAKSALARHLRSSPAQINRAINGQSSIDLAFKWLDLSGLDKTAVFPRGSVVAPVSEKV